MTLQIDFKADNRYQQLFALFQFALDHHISEIGVYDEHNKLIGLYNDTKFDTVNPERIMEDVIHPIYMNVFDGKVSYIRYVVKM